MTDIANYTIHEHTAVRTTLDKRWKNDEVNIQIVDVEESVADSDKESVTYPAFYWEFEDYHFLVLKSGKSKYRFQFFYQDSEDISVETLEFDDIAECTMTLLQLQANHALSIKVPDEDA